MMQCVAVSSSPLVIHEFPFKLLYFRCQFEKACISSPCRNRGVCFNNEETAGFTCQCQPDYTGEYTCRVILMSHHVISI